MWFFPENPNGWSPDPADKSPSSWYSVDFKQSAPLARSSFTLRRWRTLSGAVRLPVAIQNGELLAGHSKQQRSPARPLANGENRIEFPAVSTQELRIVFTNPPIPDSFRLIEIEAFAP